MLAAYDFRPGKDLLAQILALNQAVAERIAQGQPVTPPGLPPETKARDEFITADCIQPK